MKLLLALIFTLFATLPAWAGHEEAAAKSPWGMGWFCNRDVALYMHPFLPAKATIIERENIQDKEYIALFVYVETPDNIVAESIHEVLEDRFGPVLYFKTLPEGRVLCNTLQEKET